MKHPLEDNLFLLIAFALAGSLAGGQGPEDAVEDAVDAALIVKEELKKLNGSGKVAGARSRESAERPKKD